MADACRGSRASDGCVAYHRDTPPVDERFVGAGLLARGSQLCPAFPKPSGFSDFVGQRLAAYSCGGSAGIAPASLLAPGQAKLGEPRRTHLSATRRARQLDLIGCPAAKICTAGPKFWIWPRRPIDRSPRITPDVDVTVPANPRFGG